MRRCAHSCGEDLNSTSKKKKHEKSPLVYHGKIVQPSEAIKRKAKQKCGVSWLLQTIFSTAMFFKEDFNPHRVSMTTLLTQQTVLCEKRTQFS